MGPAVVYVDTSAMAALLVEQPESLPLETWLVSADVQMVSSDLLETELRRIVVREGLDQVQATAILDRISLFALERPTYRAAGLLPMPYLRSLDALHLESALRVEADAVLTYDLRLQEAARAVGLDVIAPGQR